ncbi:MAG: hypothetical protein PHX04_02005 [Bacilli bacterium]|nr:hypothetical protein [Bacilli bacterium]
MDKLKEVLTNLYNGDSEIMIYIYMAIAVISLIIVILIIISTFISRKSNKKLDTSVLTEYGESSVISEESLKMEELEPEKETIISVKENPVIVEETLQRNAPPMIKPKINLEFTPITPIELDSIEEEDSLPETKELILNPKVLKSFPAKELDFPKKIIENENMDEESLDTKINIFSHEPLAEIPKFDPFKPKTQEELVPLENPKENKLSAEDIKHRLAMLQSSLPKKTESEKIVIEETKEPAKELNEVLSNIGLDEIPDLYENKTEEVNYLR